MNHLCVLPIKKMYTLLKAAEAECCTAAVMKTLRLLTPIQCSTHPHLALLTS